MGAGLFLLLLLVVLVLLLGIWLGLLLARGRRPPPPPPPPPPCTPVYKVPDHFGEADLSATLSQRLQGTASNGAPLPLDATAGTGAPTKVVWVDHGNEVLVHLDSTAVRILDRLVLVSVDLETDQTGRTPLVCTFAVSGEGELGGLVATTDDLPRGSGLLAATWGQQLQTAVWSSLIGLSNDHATERAMTPRGLSASAGTLSLSAGNTLVTTPSPGGAA